jgi:hypothetical protein
MADYIVMARDTTELTGRDWILQLTAAQKLRGFSTLTGVAHHLKAGDRVLYYWTTRKLFLGTAVLKESPRPVAEGPSTPLLADSNYEFGLTEVRVWAEPVPLRLINERKVGITWSPDSVVRLKSVQYETLVQLATAVAEVTNDTDQSTVEQFGTKKDVSEHCRVQGLLTKLGMRFRYQVWLPANNRVAVRNHKDRAASGLRDWGRVHCTFTFARGQRPRVKSDSCPVVVRATRRHFSRCRCVRW